MSTLAVVPPLFDPVGAEPTLDEVLVDAWEGLAAHRVVECPVCSGEMDPSGPPPIGRCSACGSTLS